MPEEKRATFAAWCVRGATAVATLLSLSVAAHAGGYDTGERDWDFLFQPNNFAVEAGARYIDPQRYLKNVSTTAGGVIIPPATSASVREAAPFSVERLGLALHLGDRVRCLGSYQQPWGGHADYGSTWAASGAAITQDFTSNDYGLTCALSSPLAMGNLIFLGGVSYQDIQYVLTQNAYIPGNPPIGPIGIATTNVSDGGVGWRVGIGYEIPAIRPAGDADLQFRDRLRHDRQIHVAVS